MHFGVYINFLQTENHFSLHFGFHLINLLIIKHLKNKRSVISQVTSTYRFLINQPQSVESRSSSNCCYHQQILVAEIKFNYFSLPEERPEDNRDCA